jgi:putative intracellular protease/amidase
MPASRVLIPIPARDFDPTEVAVPWSVLSGQGHHVIFATPDGKPGQADPIMVTGEGLDFWGFLPGLRRLKLVGLVLRADRRGRAAYARMLASESFRSPLAWQDIDPASFDALVLPGGHRARGMRAYLESPVLQAVTAAFFAASKPVGAICHGVLLAARSRDATGKSVLYGRRTTALTWQLERTGWRIARLTRFWDPDYYRTYKEAAGEPDGYMSVQQEVIRNLATPADFVDVPPDDPHRRRRTSGTMRDSDSDLTPTFVVTDGNYVSARWPGDAHGFASALGAIIGRNEAKG